MIPRTFASVYPPWSRASMKASSSSCVTRGSARSSDFCVIRVRFSGSGSGLGFGLGLGFGFGGASPEKICSSRLNPSPQDSGIVAGTLRGRSLFFAPLLRHCTQSRNDSRGPISLTIRSMRAAASQPVGGTGFGTTRGRAFALPRSASRQWMKSISQSGVSSLRATAASFRLPFHGRGFKSTHFRRSGPGQSEPVKNWCGLTSGPAPFACQARITSAISSRTSSDGGGSPSPAM